MKLAVIKARLIEAYFSAAGQGVDEEHVSDYSGALLKLVESKGRVDIPTFDEHEDATLAYRALTKGDEAVAYVLDEDGQALYVMARSGKRFASVNLTSPSRAERPCTLREVREAFNQAAELGSSVVFKVATA